MKHARYRQKIEAYFEHELPSYLELLRQMVEINSFTENPSGVNRLGELIMGAFAGLGFKAKTVQAANPDYGKHLVLTKQGAGKRKIGLISHLDTVFPPEEEAQNNFAWREEGNRIYGPGTIDIKGGTVIIFMILAALKEFVPKMYDDITWLVLLDAAEERGGFDFGQLCQEQLKDNTVAALVFEAGKSRDGLFQIVAARKGIATFDVIAEGRASHAGSSHTYGANAIIQLADTIQHIARLTDYNRDLTYNVGVISGGTVTNRVPHQARARVEMRAFSVDTFEAGIAQMLALNGRSTISSPEDGYPCRISVRLRHQMPPWTPNPNSDHLLNYWKKAGRTLAIKVDREERGGLSDGNFLWRQIPTIDGLGPSGGNAHCSEQSADGSKEQEFIYVPSLIPKALLNTIAILKLIEAET